MTNVQTIDTLLFDLDGTLVDSIGDIAYALNVMRQFYHLACVDIETVKSIVGEGFPKTVREILKLDFSQNHIEKIQNEAYQIAFNAYMQHIGVSTRVYPSARTLLKQICDHKRYKVALVTNKEAELTYALLEQLNLSDHFGAIIGGNSTKHYKPHPAPVIEAVKQLRSSIDKALLIGDSQTDIKTAHRAGIQSVAVKGGYANYVSEWQYQPTYIINDLNELTSILHF